MLRFMLFVVELLVCLLSVSSGSDWSMVSTSWKMSDDVEAKVEHPMPLFDERPVVYAYTMEGCVPCRSAKKEIAGKNLPFRVVWKTDVPEWVDSLPTFHWKTCDGTWKQLKGWNGLAHLSDRVTATTCDEERPQKKSALASRAIYKQHSRQSWGVEPNTRSSIIRHLLEDGIHRGKFSRAGLESMSTSELLALHSDDHQGVVDWSIVPGGEREIIHTVKVSSNKRSGCSDCKESTNRKRSFLFWEW